VKRKIVQHGPGTLTVSLPASFIRTFSLHKGDDVIIEPVRNGLLLRASTLARGEQACVSIKGLTCLATRVIAAYYKAGYDELRVSYETREELLQLRRTTSTSYVGFEIIEETPTLVVMRAISEATQEDFRAVFRRLFRFLLLTADEGLLAARVGDHGAYEQLVLRDKLMNRLANFCRRMITKRAQTEYHNEGALYHIVEQLEKIGDHYRDLNQQLLRSPSPSGSTLLVYERVNALLRAYEACFFEFTLPALDRLVAACDATIASISYDAADPRVLVLLERISVEVRNLSGPTMIVHL